MFTAKIISKVKENGILAITVEFSDGVETYTEVVKPQDENGFLFWVQSRLTSLNTSKTLETADNVGKVIEVNPAPKPPTAAEIARDTWLAKYRLWVRIKTSLIDTGIITAANPKAAALLADVKSTILPEYIDLI